MGWNCAFRRTVKNDMPFGVEMKLPLLYQCRLEAQNCFAPLRFSGSYVVPYVMSSPVTGLDDIGSPSLSDFDPDLMLASPSGIGIDGLASPGSVSLGDAGNGTCGVIHSFIVIAGRNFDLVWVWFGLTQTSYLHCAINKKRSIYLLSQPRHLLVAE
jgi:hypothetical protein